MAQTDLHIHSSLTAGGELSPRALAERCCEARLTLAALTDRRAVSGVPECIWRGAQLGVRIVPGIELDSGGNGISSRSASALTSPVRRCSRLSGRGTIRCSRLQPSRRFTRFTKQADWPCSCRRMRWTTPFRWRHSTALRHTAVTPGRTLRGISRWHANTVCSLPAAAAFSARTSRRIDRVQWIFMDTNRRLQRRFSPQSTI